MPRACDSERALSMSRRWLLKLIGAAPIVAATPSMPRRPAIGGIVPGELVWGETIWREPLRFASAAHGRTFCADDLAIAVAHGRPHAATTRSAFTRTRMTTAQLTVWPPAALTQWGLA